MCVCVCVCVCTCACACVCVLKYNNAHIGKLYNFKAIIKFTSTGLIYDFTFVV